MNNKLFLRFYLLLLAGVILASSYPIYMGILVITEMLSNGAVPMEIYPKYIIPYTPIAVALMIGTLFLPIFQYIFKKLDFLFGTAFSIVIFFIAERLMETKILVQSQDVVLLESWQMSLCYVPPQEYKTRTWEAVDVLLGGYSPFFKLHFYIISVVLLVTILNCIYGFAKMLHSGDRTRKRALIIQAVTCLSFLGMCIWACFTAFYRTGEITVPIISAILMAIYFALIGITMGVFISSFTLGQNIRLSILLPAFISSFVTLVMYIGEMILLSGNLYRFGSGALFNGIPYINLAPIDILIIFASGGITAIVCRLINHS